jgi:hypothetical protein
VALEIRQTLHHLKETMEALVLMALLLAPQAAVAALLRLAAQVRLEFLVLAETAPRHLYPVRL